MFMRKNRIDNLYAAMFYLEQFPLIIIIIRNKDTKI